MSRHRGNDLAGAYVPGTSVAVAGSSAWVLVAASTSDARIASLWELLRQPTDPVALTNSVRALAFEELTLVSTSDREIVVMVIGRGHVDLELGDGICQLSCPVFAATAEYILTKRPKSIRLASGDETAAGGEAWPLAAGVVRAGAVVLDCAPAEPSTGRPVKASGHHDPDLTGERSPLEHLDPTEHAAASGAVLELEEPTRDADAAVDHPGEAPAAVNKPGVARPVVSHPTLPTSPEPADDAPEPVATPAIDVADDIPAAEVAASASGNPYDELFGLTRLRAVEDAAWRDSDGPEAPVEPLAPVVRGVLRPAEDQPTHAASALRSAPSAPPPVAQVMIDAVPGATRSPASAPTPSAGPPPPGGDEAPQMTVSRAALDAARRAGEGSATGGAPTVHAIRCASGHPNPAHAGTCRVCGESIADQPPVTLPRPILGILRLSTGDTITLDRGVLLGRGPSQDRLVGGERPHVIRLPPDHTDLSRNHLEVRLDGWHVLVTDLESYNGTVVAQPGRAPERLRPDQPTMIEPGTVVHLSDTLHFVFEAVA